MNRFLGWLSGFVIMITCIIGLCSALYGAEQLPQTATNKPPNIVFIFSDDHAFQAISAYNDPRRLIDTPHIDRLAREGMRFDRCVVPNSICGPSRASVLTGKYSHLNGFYNNSTVVLTARRRPFPSCFTRPAIKRRFSVNGTWSVLRPASMSGTYCQGRASTTTPP